MSTRFANYLTARIVGIYHSYAHILYTCIKYKTTNIQLDIWNIKCSCGNENENCFIFLTRMPSKTIKWTKKIIKSQN